MLLSRYRQPHAIDADVRSLRRIAAAFSATYVFPVDTPHTTYAFFMPLFDVASRHDAFDIAIILLCRHY